MDNKDKQAVGFHFLEVGTAGTMPGTSGFTMACFKASDVPFGAKLYMLIEVVRDGMKIDDDEVVVMMNTFSGSVFLTNSEYEVAMESDGKLYSFYSSPYEGKEGSFEELLEEYADMHHEDQEWFKGVAERLGRTDELPQDEEGE